MKNSPYIEEYQVERMINEGGIGPELSYLYNIHQRKEIKDTETNERGKK